MKKYLVVKPYVNKNTKQVTLVIPKRQMPPSMKSMKDIQFKVKAVRLK